MKLFIHNPYQNPIELEIAATAKVFDLKEMITTQINGVMIPDQVLKYCSKILNDSDTLQTAGIQPNSVVQLAMKENFKIFIKTEDDRILELNVNYTNTGELLKKLINVLLKIAVENQKLIFNGKELHNGDILTEKSVKPGSTISLMVENVTLDLSIVQQSGEVERIVMPKKSTIGQLKKVLLAKYNIPQGYITLTYDGQVLDNNEKTFADYKIENLSEINLRKNDLEIFIQSTTLGRNRITLRAFPVDTVDIVKGKIEAESKINKTVQQLIWNGKVLEDNAILSVEKIYGGSTLMLLVTVQNLKLKVQVAPEERIQIDAQSTETVAQLKNKLLNVTQIPVNQQILFVDNTKMEDSKMLIDYGLNESSDIALERQDTFDILIESFTGRQITVRVHKDDKVSNVKNLIDRRLGIKPEHQRLIYCGQELEDEQLEDYQIDKRCTIHLVSRVKGGIVNVLQEF